MSSEKDGKEQCGDDRYTYSRKPKGLSGKRFGAGVEHAAGGVQHVLHSRVMVCLFR